MNSISKEIINNLNKRLITQGIIIETLCDILINEGLVTEDELEDMIRENIESQQDYIDKTMKEETEDNNLSLMGLHFGPIGEA